MATTSTDDRASFWRRLIPEYEAVCRELDGPRDTSDAPGNVEDVPWDTDNTPLTYVLPLTNAQRQRIGNGPYAAHARCATCDHWTPTPDLIDGACPDCLHAHDDWVAALQDAIEDMAQIP